MSSDNESDTGDTKSEIHFVPQSDDEEVLWSVQEITAERGNKYKVKWVGTDPATGKPWAQSWVPKYDCTDDLVVEWKAKKRLAARKRKPGGRGGSSTASRVSGSSKRAGSSVSVQKTRLQTSEAASSCLNSGRQVSPPPSPQPPPPPPVPSIKSIRKRKRQSTSLTTNGAEQVIEQNEPRPRKKQKILLERLLVSPFSSDEDGDDAPPRPGFLEKIRLKKKGLLKDVDASSDSFDEEGSLPPRAIAKVKGKGKAVPRLDGHSKDSALGSVASDSSDSRVDSSRTKTEVVPRHTERVADANAVSTISSEDAETLQLKSKNKHFSSEQNGDAVKGAQPGITIKVGPPRDIKRTQTQMETGFSKPGPSRSNPCEDGSTDELVQTQDKGCAPDEAAAFGKPLLLMQDTVESPTSSTPPPHITTSPVHLTARPRSPDLSPGTRERLDIFDQMMAEMPQSEATPSRGDAPAPMPDDIHDNYNDTHDIDDSFPAFDPDPPRPLSPLPSKSKQDAPKKLVVSESESSGFTDDQPYSFPPRPPLSRPSSVRESPCKQVDLPSIAVITATATSSSASPQDIYHLPPKRPSSSIHPSKRPVKPVPQITPNTFRSKVNAHSHITHPEAPPSSIESFTSPKRVDKGKDRAIENDHVESSPSESERDGERWKRPLLKKITDSGLKRRGKELYEQVQFAREAEQRKKRKPKRLKPVSNIDTRPVSSPPKGSPLPNTSGAESTLETRWEDVFDLSGCANSATLDTAEHSVAKSLSEADREHLRIELRQEEEESTQEMMGVYPPLPAKTSTVMNGGDALPPHGSSERSPSRGQNGDVDRAELPSAELQQASVIVHPSQGRRHDDTDMEVLPNNRPASSPRLIPENLTDSPKRRLGEALSLLNVKSEEIQRLERELTEARRNVQNLKAELAEMQQSSEPTAPVRAAWEAERAQWTQERSKWENDFATWETQRKGLCDDKTDLLARVAELSDVAARAEEVNVKMMALEAERVAWTKERDALHEMTQRSDELAALTKARGEDDQRRIEWEAERASWAEEKAGWETERVALQVKQESASRSVEELTASVESLKSAKVSAEKDRDFFHEQYAQASGFVNSVREENKELEKRVEIAEGQAQEGVAAIKMLYEGRIKALQADVFRWKGLTELLQEKDRRTNDELRLRAAQAPELGDLCNRLTAENKSLVADVRKFGLAQQRTVIQRNKLYYEILILKQERASLRSKLSKLADAVEGGGTEPPPRSAPAVLQESASVDHSEEILAGLEPLSLDVSFDEPALFPCMWRPQLRDQCQHVFDTKEDLERHVQQHLRELVSMCP